MPKLFPYFIAFTVTIATILLLRPLAIRLDLMDEPGGRKHHKGNIPLIGGIAMFLGLGFSLLTLDVSLSHYRSLIASISLLVVTGLLDDFHELSPRSKLFIQIFVGILMAWWGDINLQSFGDLFSLGEIKTGFLAFPLTVIAVVTLINAVNMTDGVDGLAGSITFIEFFYLAWLSHHAHLLIDKQIIYLIIMSLLAFLFFNFPWRQRASVFMGDSGSMMLGFLLSWFCISLSQIPHFAARPVVFLWIMAIPLWDISSVVVRRLTRGFSPFQADRGHLHHYLLKRGFSSLQVTFMISLLSGILGLMGILGERYHIRESILFINFISLFFIYLLMLYSGWQKIGKNSIKN